MRVIDAHSHIAPRVMLRALEEGRDWFGARFVVDDAGRTSVSVRGRRGVNDPRFRWTLEQRVAEMDRIGTDVQLISTAPVLFNYDLDPGDGLRASRELNNDIAGAVAEHPDRFRGLGSLPMQDVDLAISELERNMEIGNVGVSLATNVNGSQWYEARFRRLFEVGESLGALFFFHANRSSLERAVGRYHLWNTIGHPVESAIAGAALIMAGILDRHPDLKVILAHGGGNLCFGIPRIDRGWQLRDEYREHISRPPSQYLRNMYYDSITWGEAQLRFLIDQVGADRVVIGSDWPAQMGPESPYEWISGLESLTRLEKERICHGNLEHLLGI